MITCHGSPRGGGQEWPFAPPLENLWGALFSLGPLAFFHVGIAFLLVEDILWACLPVQKILWHVHVIFVISIQVSIINTILVHVNSVCTIIHVRVVSAIHRGASAHTVVLFTSSLVVLHTHVDLILSLLFCKCV